MRGFTSIRKITRKLQQGRDIFLLCISSILCVAKDLGGVITLAYATDQVISGGSHVATGLMAMIIVMLVGVIIAGMDRYIKGQFALSTRKALLTSFEEKILKLPVRGDSLLESGEIITRYTGDIQKLIEWYENTFPSILQLFFYLAGALIYSLSRSVSLTLVVVPVVAIVMPFLLAIAKRLTGVVEKERKAADKSLSHMKEMLADPEFLKAYSLEDTMNCRVGAILEERSQAEKKASRVKALTGSVSFVTSYLPGIFAAVVGGYYLYNGWITVGFLVGFIQMVMGRFTYVFPKIGSFFNKTNEADVYAERIIAFLDQEEEEKVDMVPAFEDAPIVEFDHVSFSYPGQSSVILQDVSFTLHKGEQIALVGDSGGGKSTIIKLIMGFYSKEGEYSGHIRVMGREISKWDGESLRREIAPVFQDSVLFPGTLRENIQMGNTKATEAQVLQAIERAGLSDIPLDREVGERGGALSGGQRQRVAIGRALVKDASLYLLDEPMSALDTMTENQLMHELGRVMEGKTVITIAHRLSTICNMQRIYYIDNGQIQESGTHEELMKLQGKYAALYSKQKEEDRDE